MIMMRNYGYVLLCVGMAFISIQSEAMLNNKKALTIIKLNSINTIKNTPKFILNKSISEFKKIGLNQKRFFHRNYIMLYGQKGWDTGKQFGEGISKTISDQAPDIAGTATRLACEYNNVDPMTAEIASRSVEKAVEICAPLLEKCVEYSCAILGSIGEETHECQELVDLYSQCMNNNKN